MAEIQYQLEAGVFVNETADDEYQIAPNVFVNETVAEAPPIGAYRKATILDGTMIN